jgi:hypothetical protein
VIEELASITPIDGTDAGETIPTPAITKPSAIIVRSETITSPLLMDAIRAAAAVDAVTIPTPPTVPALAPPAGVTSVALILTCDANTWAPPSTETVTLVAPLHRLAPAAPTARALKVRVNVSIMTNVPTSVISRLISGVTNAHATATPTAPIRSVFPRNCTRVNFS